MATLIKWKIGTFAGKYFCRMTDAEPIAAIWTPRKEEAKRFESELDAETWVKSKLGAFWSKKYVKFVTTKNIVIKWNFGGDYLICASRRKGRTWAPCNCKAKRFASTADAEAFVRSIGAEDWLVSPRPIRFVRLRPKARKK